MTDNLTDQDWHIRLSIYRQFVDRGRPPTAAEIASEFRLGHDMARQAYHRLHRGHAIFLEPGTDEVRMANPLSAVPTPYMVRVNGRTLYANCAWDALGIPAMLAADALVEAQTDPRGEPVSYSIEGGELRADDRLIVHFPLPFRVWYDDLVHT
jgi:hypothetical protein